MVSNRLKRRVKAGINTVGSLGTGWVQCTGGEVRFGESFGKLIISIGGEADYERRALSRLVGGIYKLKLFLCCLFFSLKYVVKLKLLINLGL